MVDTSDQIHPIASPAAAVLTSDDRKTAAGISDRRRRRIKRCAYIAAGILLVTAAIFLTLALTVFGLKRPTIRVHRLTIGELDLAGGANVTLNADVSVRNPNFASFAYSELTTALFYRGAVVGEGSGPPGRAAARRTTRVNLTVGIVPGRILSRPDFDLDLVSGLVNMSSYTRVGGRMRIFVVVEKKLTVKMNCNMTLNITSRSIQQHTCKRKVKL